ncbi:cell division protein ZapA [Lutibacter sp. B2]|nr:cell division protein ZapA [Lutibacter sp. B2]
MSEKNKVIVNIHGQEYTMVGSESQEYMQHVAKYVNDKMTEVARNSRQLSTSMIAVLTCLNVGDDYIKNKDELEKLQIEVIKPLQELEEMRMKLEGTIEEFQNRESEYKEAIRLLEEEKKTIKLTLKEKNEALKESENFKELLSLKEQELVELTEENEELHEKIFDGQMKYVQARKELDSFIETFDEKDK